MTIDLVGYTGFVGSNLLLSYKFDHIYNSKNIESAYNTQPDIIVYAGVTGTKYIANKFPEKDWLVIQNAMTNISKIKPKKLVLISTIDIFVKPDGEDEDSEPTSSEGFVYGNNRRLLEEWVKDNIKDYLIVRLPGIYGENLKKNFIYDLINPIPQALTPSKFDELVKLDYRLSEFYKVGDDGFYHPNSLGRNSSKELRDIFDKIGFNALNFTDSRGVFQYYNLSNLWQHIQIALREDIKVLNIATEPFSIAELHMEIYNKPFKNEVITEVPYYNFKTKYAQVFFGRNGYILSKEAIINDIKQFLENHK